MERRTGRLVTSKQKVAANPEVEKLVGAPNFEVQVVANRPREPQFQGLSGAVYDGYHPFNREFLHRLMLQGCDSLKAACEVVRHFDDQVGHCG